MTIPQTLRRCEEMDLASIRGGLSALRRKRKMESIERDCCQNEAKITVWKSSVQR